MPRFATEHNMRVNFRSYLLLEVILAELLHHVVHRRPLPL